MTTIKAFQLFFMKVKRNVIIRKYFPYLTLLLLLLLANWQQIFCIDFFVADDSFMYRDALNNNHYQYFRDIFGKDIWFTWPSLCNHLRRTLFWELCEYSIPLARFVLFFGCYVPLSWVCYYIFKKYFDLPSIVALAASALPSMFPLRTSLPAGMNASYQVFGLLLAMLALLSLIHYLHIGKASRLFLTSLLYFVSVNSMEQAVFLLLPFSLLALHRLKHYHIKNFLRWFLVLSSFSAIALYKVILILGAPRAAGAVTPLTWQQRYERLRQAFLTIDPIAVYLHKDIRFYYLIILLSLLIVIIVLSLKKIHVKCELSQDLLLTNFFQSEFFLILIAISWIICSSVAFIFVSRDFSGRYFHIAAFAYTALYVSVFYYAVKKLSLDKLFFVIIILLLFLNAFVSFYQSKKSLKIENEIFCLVEGKLQNRDFPENSQFVIIGTFGLGYGLWPRTDGIVKKMTGRMDLTGIMPTERHFYDPFNGYAGRGWDNDKRMTGLILNDPVFIFRSAYSPEQGRTLRQIPYGLRWKQDGRWMLYEFDLDDGMHAEIARGHGQDKYHQFLEKFLQSGISMSDIAWSGFGIKKQL